MSLEVHQKSDQDLKNIRRFYSLGWPTEKQSTLAGLQTKKDLEKRHLIGLGLRSLLGRITMMKLACFYCDHSMMSTYGKYTIRGY